MTKVRLKLPIFFLIVVALVILPFLTLKYTNNESEEVIDSTMDEIIEPEIPVVNEVITIINPYTDQSVTVKRGYYDSSTDEDNQASSIIKHDNTYIQNTGIDYVGENTFDVVSILNGIVINVKEDEELGKSVEIRHDNGIISIYQSLSEVYVNKDDVISQGVVIGRSGENKLDKDLGNHLHFEIYDNGQAVNPYNYLNTQITLEKGN
ncbi:MAG: M23 family metallopeptidase [Bacilli bacterium]|nr:M23 family metallopeptidase [Bacilli bacterium]